MGIWRDIREGTGEVCREAVGVEICEEGVGEFAGRLVAEGVRKPRVEQALSVFDGDCEQCAFVLLMNAINFGSGYSTLVKKREGLGFYFTFARGLEEYLLTHGFPNAEALQRFTVEELARIFSQPLDHPAIRELLGLYCEAWRQLGELLETRYQGEYLALLEEAAHSAERLCGLLCLMPFFRDQAPYGGREVLFLKRAQITAADLALAFNETSWGAFSDINELTMFADNKVPHVLRLEGALAYSPALATRIDQGELLLNGSPEEVEIRAAGVQAVEQLTALLRQQGADLYPRDVDYILWLRGQDPRYKVKPSHRTRCVYY